MAIRLNVVEVSGNYFFEEDSPTPTTFRSKVVNYALGAHKVFIERAAV